MQTFKGEFESKTTSKIRKLKFTTNVKKSLVH